MATLIKQSSEIFPVAFDFAGQMPEGAALASGAVAALDLTTGIDVTGTFLQSPVATIQGTLAMFRVQLGTDGHRYKVTCLVTLTTADILEEDLFVEVRNI